MDHSISPSVILMDSLDSTDLENGLVHLSNRCELNGPFPC